MKEILKAADLNETDIHVQRLGRFDSSTTNRCRPIKVKLSCESAVSSFLKLTNRIKTSGKWKTLSFSRDRTLMQREIYKSAKAELAGRLSKGEQNLRIKYKNGIPTIVTSEN